MLQLSSVPIPAKTAVCRASHGSNTVTIVQLLLLSPLQTSRNTEDTSVTVILTPASEDLNTLLHVKDSSLVLVPSSVGEPAASWAVQAGTQP